MILKNINDFRKNVPSKGRILALDVGTKKIGVAICDDTQIIASPKIILKRQSNIKDFATLLSIIQENHIIGLVIGYPIKMDNSQNNMTIFVDKFVENFEKFLKENLKENLALIMFDERLSSFEARRYVNKNSRYEEDYDDISASLILENFLNNLR